MDDIQRALVAAWTKIRPRLERDAAGLRRRLLRRRAALLQSPPRAWCLAVRASDTRLSDETRVNRPDELSPPLHPSSFRLHPSSPHSPHQLTLDSDDLRELCAPVELLAPGEPLAVVADRLGTTRSGLLNARIKKRFHTHHVGALDGHWGKPHPMLYAPGPLDPATRGFPAPDPLFSITSKMIGSRIPDRIRAKLVRVPVFHDATRAYRDKSDLHPEHPDVDQTFDTRRKKRNQKLPPPDPDPVAYKWKGDQYVGYDWRAAATNPRIKENYERHQRELARYRAANKRRPPKPSQSTGSLKFRGWAWLCPDCHRAVRVLYYPLPRLHLLPGKIPRLPRDEMKQLNLPHPPPPHFACQKCHRLRRFSSLNKGTWGEIVCYLSAGLLYGHEVPRPVWLRPQRKNQYAPKPNRDPSMRRPQIERLLLTGLTINEVAATLGLSKGTILFYTKSIYHQYGVRCLKDLLIQHGLPTRPGMRGPARGRRGGGRVSRARNMKRHARAGDAP